MSKARDLADLGGVTTRLDQVGNSDGALSNRNLLINSEFRVNQRGVTSITANSGEPKFLADRWIAYCSAVSWSASIQEVTLPDGTVANSLKTVATSAATNAFFHPYQKVETYGKDYLQGKKVVLSAWVRTNVAGQFIRICDSVNCHLLGTTIPADGQWHKVSAVHTMPTSMNTGASNNIQFQPLFNTVSLATNDYCEVALPQMELGDTSTDFEHTSYSDELHKCRRYFYNLQSAGAYTRFGVGENINASIAQCFIDYPIEMRVKPSLVTSGIPSVYALYHSTDIRACTSIALDAYTTTHTGVIAAGVSGTPLLDGGASQLMANNNSSTFLAFDAEL